MASSSLKVDLEELQDLDKASFGKLATFLPHPLNASVIAAYTAPKNLQSNLRIIISLKSPTGDVKIIFIVQIIHCFDVTEGLGN